MFYSCNNECTGVNILRQRPPRFTPGCPLGALIDALGVCEASETVPRRDATRSAINAQRHSRNDPTIRVMIGDEYAIYINESMYGVLNPDAQITYAGIQRLAEQLQPRFVGGSPPDVIDNSGAGALDETALVAEGQLADFAGLMAAPAYDTEDANFAETLVPGTQESGIFDGTRYLLN